MTIRPSSSSVVDTGVFSSLESQKKPKTTNQRRFDGSTLTATRVRGAIVFPPVRCGPGARTARSVRGRRRDRGARRFGAPLAPASAARAGARARAERSTGGGGDRRAGAGRDRSAGRARARARAAPPAWIFPREKEKRAEALSEALRAIGGGWGRGGERKARGPPWSSPAARPRGARTS